MSRGLLAVVALLVVGLSVAPIGAVATVSQSPSSSTTTEDADQVRPTINASINGQSITDGGFEVVYDGARLQLNVSMADANATLDTVIVRVDGETVIDRSSPGPTVSINRSLPIGGGNNTVRIIAEGSNEAVRSMQFRVYLESVPPALELESPVDTLPQPYQYPDLVVERTDIRLRGQFNDLSGFGVASFTFRRPGNSEPFDGFDVQGDPTFDEQVLLQYGHNVVELETRDVLDNSYFNTFSITVVDRDAPELDLGFESQQEQRPRYTVTGNVSDSVWIRNVSVDVYHYNHGPYEPARSSYVPVADRRYTSRSRDRLAASFSQEVRLIEGLNLVVVQARDVAGHDTVRRFFITYEPDEELPPTISVIRNRTIVRSNTSLDLAALVSDGDEDLSRVVVEARSLETGAVTDIESIRPDENATFLLERALNISAGVNQIDIRAIDERGEQSERRFFIDTSQRLPLSEPPAGYEQIDDSNVGTTPAGESTTPTTAVPTTTQAAANSATATPDRTTTATTTDSTDQSGAGDDDDSEGDEASSDDDQASGGLLAGVPVLPVLGALVVILVGGFFGYRRLMRV
jgi:hypothetical protein